MRGGKGGSSCSAATIHHSSLFCTAAADRKLRLLTSDLQDRHEVKVMEGHTSYINHLVFEPTEGKQIASVSDDHTCRSKPFYFHVWCGTWMEMKIQLSDFVLLASVCAGTQRKYLSYPQEKRPAHIDKARLFKWSRANENLFATTGCPGKISSQLLIHHLGHPQPVMLGSATVGSGLSWHRTLPLCVIGGDRKLCFWMTEM
eukprot:superscaffoldBa00002415_g14166